MVDLNTTFAPATQKVTTVTGDVYESSFVFLVISCVCAGLWVIYLTFYHSRMLGFILTEIVNLKYMKDGQYFKIGSVSVSFLSGKVMFRDVRYITRDLTFRLVDGFAIFKYWLPFKPVQSKRPYQVVPSDVETESAEQRLIVWLNGLEYHVYSRSGLYGRLEELFKRERYGDAAKSNQNILAPETKSDPEAQIHVERSEGAQGGLPSWFMELVPTIKFDINTGKVAFGNKLLETTLCVQFESAAGIYTTSQANSSLDEFMHLVRCQGKNVRVMLSPSPGYTGARAQDEPPRYMGEGFVVTQTSECKLTYYQDEPGFIPSIKPDGETVLPDSDPLWGVDVQFNKGTTLCYGPWVDRQRVALQNFFYPLDYQGMAATKPSCPGQRRIHTGLDVKFEFDCNTTMDVLFSKNRETKAVHLCVGADSHVRVYQPWIVNDYGYTTSVVAKLFQVEATTSLSYRPLVEADVLDLAFHTSFPRVWNETQHWSTDVTACKVTWHFLFAHKLFFQEMIDDWTLNYCPDLLTFVPYEWSFNIVLKDFEMVWLTNQHNWIECTSTRQENAQVAFCGELFDLTFVLQYLRFVPEIEDIKFFLQVDKLVARMFLPEHNTLRRSLLSLVRSGERRREPGPRSRSSTATANLEEGVESADENPRASGADEDVSRGWRRHTEASLGWVDVMSVPILGLMLGYRYHPIVRNAKNLVPKNKPLPVDPTEWEPDVITLELDAGPTAVKLCGALIRAVLAIKENYFGIDQEFKDCAAASSLGNSAKMEVSSEAGLVQEGGVEMVSLPSLRPFEANIFISLTDIKAELSKHCGPAEPTCPLLLMERLSFEMHKTYSETRLQLHLSPATILTTDSSERGYSSQHLSNGHVSLSGLQLRGHAMFSGEDRPPDVETLEYAWLVELQLGILSGKVTLPQLQSLGNWAETFVFHVADKENELQAPCQYKQCIHGRMQHVCERRNFKRKASRIVTGKAEAKTRVEPSGTLERNSASQSHLCYFEDDLKYRMTRISLENINLFVVESGCACNLEVSPIRFATCDLHGQESGSGASFFVQTLRLRQFVLAPWSEDPQLLLQGAVQKRFPGHEDVIWLEAGAVHLGPVISDVSSATADPELYIDQKDFLEMHDNKFQRLWFLWDPDHRNPHKRHGFCGCVGGCNFFGKNANGPKFFSAEKLDASDNDTGVGGFGSEGGFYEDADMLDSGVRPLMYSRDTSLDALGPSFMDRSPVGSVEAFTRKRYHVSASESSSPRMHRAGNCLKPDGFDLDPRADNASSHRYSYISYSSSQNASSNMHERMRYTRSSSGQSLNRATRKPSSSKSAGLHKVGSQFSRESEGSFYSCGSLLDDLDGSLRRGMSAESFVSAVEDPVDLMQFDESAVLSRFIVSSPALVNKYSQHLTLMDCLNWSTPYMLPPEKRQFSIIQNLKETDSEDLLLPGVPLFTCRGEPKLEVPLLVKRYQGRKRAERRWKDEEQGSSSSEESVSLNATVRKSTPQPKYGRKEDSMEMLEASEQESSRKTQWNTVINTQDKTSFSSLDVSPANTLERRPKRSLNEGTVLVRIAGDINILASPLLLEALQRYLSSVARQESFLHPAAILDFVHDKCVDSAEVLYHRRLNDLATEPSNPKPPPSLQNEEPKENQMLVMLSTSKINMCFLQAATLDLESQKKSRIELDILPESTAVPTVSLLAGTVSSISSELLSIRRKPIQNVGSKEVEEGSQRSQSITEVAKDVRSASLDDAQPLRKSRGHRNTMTTGDVKCDNIQFQLRRLCEVEDVMHSITTAIPEEAAQAKFQVNSDKYSWFTEDFNTENLDVSKTLSLLMLECGLDNVVFRGGTERGSGKEVMAKLKAKTEASSRESTWGRTPKLDPSPTPQGYSNPLCARETGSVEIKTDLPLTETQSDASSISSSCSSSLGISSDGNVSDIESDSDLEASKPLLKNSREAKSTPGVKILKVKEDLQERDPEVARRTDVTVNFSNIWFNLASPSSVKTVPSNFHLYNSLVTTGVPVVTAWLLPILELKTLLSSAVKARQRFVNSVIACLLAQALPEKERIPKAHPVSGQVTEKAHFLQDDHSSQLIYLLRRQVLGSRLSKVKTSLFFKDDIPGDEDLIKGIFALARQWKCYLAGTEQGQIAFFGSNSIKRRVVGRGKLTERDRAIIFGEEKSGRVEGQSVKLESIQETSQHLEETSVIDMNVLDAEAEVRSPQHSDPVSLPMETFPKDEPNTPLLPGPVQEEMPQEETASESDVSTKRLKTATTEAVEFRKGHKKQLSLYSWLSNTPTTSPPSVRTKGADDKESSRKVSEHDRGWSFSPLDSGYALFGDMVSVPTSGKQIKDERETFKTFLQAINLMPRVAKKQDQASSFSLDTKLKCVHIHLVDGGFDNAGENGKGKNIKNPRSNQESKSRTHKQLFKDTEPVFVAQEFGVKVNVDISPSDMVSQGPLGTAVLSSDDNSTKLTRVNFVVGCTNITQRINLSCVRLTTQVIDMLDLVSDACSQRISVDEVDALRPLLKGAGSLHRLSPGSGKCWRIMYNVLNLYSSLPREAKSKGKKTSLSLPASSPEKVKREVKIDIEDGVGERRGSRGLEKRKSAVSHTASVLQSEDKNKDSHIQAVPTTTVFGVVKLAKVRLLASVGELQLETEVRDLNVSASRKEEKMNLNKARKASSVTGHLGKIKVELLEKIKQKAGTVVRCHLSRSHALFTCELRGDDDTKLALVTLGLIDVDIPQHPVALHSMMTRSSRTISSHISEIQTQRSAIRSITSAELSSSRDSYQFSSAAATDSAHASPSLSKSFSAPVDTVDGKQQDGAKLAFNFVLKGFVLGASLLPSLRAEYKMGKITSSGKSGKNSSFKLSMPVHSLSFSSKIQALGVPSSTVVDLPPVNMSGNYVNQKPRLPRPVQSGLGMSSSLSRCSSTKSHLFVTAEVGAFEHMLTTDLLNHLVFVQKSFMKEVNDVLQRVSGESQPVPLWRSASAGDLEVPREKGKVPFLYSFKLNLKGIQVTATTPSATAVRLETDVVSLEISNAVPSSTFTGRLRRSSSYVKLFGKAQVDVNLSLGQFVKSRTIDNEHDYQHLAFFKTTIGVQNSFQDGSPTGGTEGKETFLVTLTKPYVYVQQIAFDKAVLVYLNYKNAYEHWNEQRLSLNEGVHSATQAVLEKLPQRAPTTQLSGSLYLQLTVDQLGVCFPLYNTNQGLAQNYPRFGEQEPGPAVVLSVEEMLLTCCSSGSFVSRGKFKNFCLWLAEKFDSEADHWNPNWEVPAMNTCIVPEGTYELCSKTVRYPIVPDMIQAGKWVMSVRWQMRGLQVDCDTEIGKRLSSLAQTLTSLAGEPDVANMDSVTELQEKDSVEQGLGQSSGETAENRRKKRNSRNVEKKMWDQARKVNELRRRTDVENWLMEKEAKILQNLEYAVFNDFRKDFRKRLSRSRHGRARGVHSRRGVSEKHATATTDRRAHSEHVRGSRVRSRIKHRLYLEENDDENEMVEMGSPMATQEDSFFLNATDIPLGVEAEEPDGLTYSKQSSSPSASFLDALDLPCKSGAGQLSNEDVVPFRSTPHRDIEASGPRVTFNCSEQEVQDQTVISQRGALQPNLDFELDVTVEIDSGKCVLHPASDGFKEDITDVRSGMKRNQASDFTKAKIFSPLYQPQRSSVPGQRKPKMNVQDKGVQSEDTVLLFPAVNVRLHYFSNVDSEPVAVPCPPMSPPDLDTVFNDTNTTTTETLRNLSSDTPRQIAAKKAMKHAGLYVWLSLQSLPQEMVLKPSLLDFLEQALEPIVVPGDEGVESTVGSMSDASSDVEVETGSSMVSSSMSEYSSFPVDVVVVLRVQPSDIRFSCLPVSRVECMLRLPALDIVFSSNSSPTKGNPQSTHGLRQLGKDASRVRLDQQDASATQLYTFDSGGINFTVCLSRFSFCIFHPYGKQHKSAGRAPSSDLEDSAAEEGRSRFHFIPTQPLSGKKDSLSLNVEFIKFNLSRRRVANSSTGSTGGIEDLAAASSSTVVKVSGVCDIGSAAFNYDMRRLNEILDFPKAWYKRGLGSRIFLGKEGTYATKKGSMATDFTDTPPLSRGEENVTRRSFPDSPLSASSKYPRGRPPLTRSMSSEESPIHGPHTPLKVASEKQKQGHRKMASGSGGLFNIFPSSPGLFRSMTTSGLLGTSPSATPSPSSPTPRRSTFSEVKRKRSDGQQPSSAELNSSDTDAIDSPRSQGSSSSQGSNKSKWETVIVVALNLSRLDMSTNMGSVMGQTVWRTSDLRAQTHLTLTNTGRRNVKAKVVIRQAICESRSGIVGGHVEIHDLQTKLKVNEERGCNPEHLVNLNLRYAEARVDYMGTCILMGNLAAFRTNLHDEWMLQEPNKPTTGAPVENGRDPVKAKIYMHGELAWTDFKVMISRSTTPDFVKMSAKIQEFFTQQHRNSMRALYTLRPHTTLTSGGLMRTGLPSPQTETHLENSPVGKDGLKYQHWGKVLNAVCGLKLSMLGFPLPDRGVLLGGTLSLQGKGVSLACFHGVNFRAQSWVLFTLERPFVQFASKVCSVEKSCQVRRARAVQELLIRLGNGVDENEVTGKLSPSSAHVAIVRKVSRGRRNPPSMGSTVQEWLGYVCATGEDEISPPETFSSERMRPNPSSPSRKNPRERKTSFTTSYRYEHDSEPIFGVPKLEVELTTEHDMPMTSVASTWSTKSVKSSTVVRAVPPTPASPHVVECSLASFFDDSLCVTTDVALFLFLHDVVQTYIKETETSTSGSLQRGGTPPLHARHDSRAEKEDKTHKVEGKRTRQFRSKAWKLEPRVRFLSWAGKNMDPVNIDWVLQKLGFTHARLTIPKWVQRGAMDPMDVFLSLLVDRLLAGMRESAAYLGDQQK